MADPALVTAVIAAVRAGDIQARSYSSCRIAASPNKALGEDALRKWKREYPFRSHDYFVEPLVGAAIDEVLKS
jgi:hypothetical protein